MCKKYATFHEKLKSLSHRVEVHAFISSTQEAEVHRSLNLQSAWSTEQGFG